MCKSLQMGSCGMMRGFQIWCQNLNWIIFNPFFGLKNVGGEIRNLASFFLGQKRRSNVIQFKFGTRFGILSFRNFLIPICKNLHILIFWPLIVISKFQSHLRDQNEHFWENKLYHVSPRGNTHQNRWYTWRNKKKLKNDEP